MGWWRKRRKAHGHEGGTCPHCGKSEEVIAVELEERIVKVMAGADDPGLAFGLPCGCEKEINEPVLRCKEHARVFN